MSSAATRLELSPSNVEGYLRERGVLPADAAARAMPLSGGISNIVLRVDWDGGSAVVKQSLPVLRVEQLWEFDPARIVVERECMEALAALLPAGSVPDVIDADNELFAFTMSCAPEGGVVWKEALLRGHVDLEVARRAGVLLGWIHRESSRDRALAERFADLMPLLQGRVDPYHRATLAAHPDLAAVIEEDIERLTTQRSALVLGDYSPKNLIAYPDRVLLLDFEVAHWGDPAFDAAFLIAHLVLKTVHCGGREYLAAARAFWNAYVAAGGGAREEDVALELFVLLLCRVDGKSKVEYLDDAERERVRRLARDLLVSGPRSLDVLDSIDTGAAAR